MQRGLTTVPIVNNSVNVSQAPPNPPSFSSKNSNSISFNQSRQFSSPNSVSSSNTTVPIVLGNLQQQQQKKGPGRETNNPGDILLAWDDIENDALSSTFRQSESSESEIKRTVANYGEFSSSSKENDFENDDPDYIETAGDFNDSSVVESDEEYDSSALILDE
jgi:hypothetical protein